MSRPNVLLILTDQLRHPPAYESEELARFRAETMPGLERLRQNGVSFEHHYPMAAACAPSRASLLTGQYPSLHGVTQTDGIAKSPDSDDMFWLAPDTVPTLGDWFRAAGYKTYFKGKWHASHAHLDAEDGDGYLLSIDDDGTPQEANIQKYLEADLLDDHGFSEWVGPEPHGLGKHNTGTVKDPFTADETIDLLRRLDAADGDEPWLTVCSFLNPHDDSLFGLVGLAQGLRYHPSQVPPVAQAPTHDEDLSTKPTCHASYNDEFAKFMAPQPWIETHLKFYYQLQATVGEQITRVLDALAASTAFENTIVVFSSDHGDMQGAHGGMHEKWHVAYEEALRVPFIVAGPPLPGEPREVEMPTNHADLIPTLLGLAGIDAGRGARDAADRPLRGPAPGRPRSLGARPRRRGRAARADPLHHRRRDQRGQRALPEPVPAGRPESEDLLDRRPAQPHRDGRRRGCRRRRAAPGQALPLPRQPAVLDGSGRARRAPAGPQDDHGHRAGARRVRALRPHRRSLRATEPRRPRVCRRSVPGVAAADGRAAGRATGAQAPRPERRGDPRLTAAPSY